jgi:hypothetical protein
MYFVIPLYIISITLIKQNLTIIFLLTCKAFTAAVHYHLSLIISLDMQGVHLNSPLSFAIKVYWHKNYDIHIDETHHPLWIQSPRLC